MSSWATQRKISIITTLIVILTFSISFIIFFVLYKPITCSDNIQNGLELGVDCGGTCENTCVLQPENLLDVWTRTFKIADGVYSAVAYIENQNEIDYVPSVQFEIVLYDAEGLIVTRTSEKAIIMPNGITPIFVPHILTGERDVKSATFRFTEELKFAPYPEPYSFKISNVVIDAKVNKSPRVTALATNTSKSIVREVDFIVIVYDEDGIAIGASRTYEENIQSEEPRYLQYTWVHPFEFRKGECPGGECIRLVKRVEIVPIVLRR